MKQLQKQSNDWGKHDTISINKNGHINNAQNFFMATYNTGLLLHSIGSSLHCTRSSDIAVTFRYCVNGDKIQPHMVRNGKARGCIQT